MRGLQVRVLLGVLFFSSMDRVDDPDNDFVISEKREGLIKEIPLNAKTNEEVDGLI